MPDVYVFPGGSVHAEDCEAEVTPGVVVPVEPLSADTALGAGMRVAAIRELFEEAGILLAVRDDHSIGLDRSIQERYPMYRAKLDARTITMAEIAAQEDCVLATDSLTHYAHWITPEAMPKRFSTHFFLAELPDGQEPTHHHLETTDGLWITPNAALEGYAAKTFPLVFATIHQLRDLATYASPAEAINAWRGRIPVTMKPRIIQRDGEQIILLPDQADPV
jgi:8-oxo-dGTP pyrophosphatase MutT (NUDIX family)